MRLRFALLHHALAVGQVLSFSIPHLHLARAAPAKPAIANNSSGTKPSSTQETAIKNKTNKIITTKVEIWAEGTRWPFKYVDAVPANSSAAARKFQPLLDFDDYTCYNMPAIDGDGNLNAGFHAYWLEDVGLCRLRWLLETKNNNIYVRRRCNNGWCAWLYAYYFPMDQVYGPLSVWHGQQHDWNSILVWTRHPALEMDGGYQKDQGNDTLRLEEVAPLYKFGGDLASFLNSPEHKLEDYETRVVGTRWGMYYIGQNVRRIEQHPKFIYGWTGPLKLKHSFRPAIAVDTKAQNEFGQYLQGGLVSWDSIPEQHRQKLAKNDWGRSKLDMIDENFEDLLNKWTVSDIELAFDSTKDAYPNIPEYAPAAVNTGLARRAPRRPLSNTVSN